MFSLSLRRGLGRGCFLPPSPFGEGRGEASVELLFRLFEILLQIIRHYCSQINSLSLKTAFVTFRKSVSYKEACKRCPFALQNMPFYTSKDALLHCKRACFTTQKGVDGKTERKEIDKRRAELRRNATAKIRPPQAQRGCLPKPLFIFAVKEKE